MILSTTLNAPFPRGRSLSAASKRINVPLNTFLAVVLALDDDGAGCDKESDEIDGALLDEDKVSGTAVEVGDKMVEVSGGETLGRGADTSSSGRDSTVLEIDSDSSTLAGGVAGLEADL